MLLGTEIADRRIWEVRPKISSFGKLFVIPYTVLTKSIASRQASRFS